jgi:CDP-glucose 4,6-dehydratase
MLEQYRNKRIFITGHTGFKGTWLSQILLYAGSEITGFALEPSTKPSLFAQTKSGRHIHSIYDNVRNRDALIQAVKQAKPDIVFHLAAQPIVRYSYREPAYTYETNVLGTVNILEALRLNPGIHSFVNVTTDKVYENKEWYWGYRETENLCGNDPYANSKSCSELVTYSYRKSFFGTKDSSGISTARSGNVIGGGDYSEDRIIPDCIRAVQARKKIVVRNPSSVRPYLHVLDTLTGYLLLALKQYADKQYEGAYNFGPDEDCCITTGELADLFCAIWGNEAYWMTKGDTGPHEDNFLKLDCSKAKAVLGWNQRWDIKAAVENVVEFAQTGSDEDRLICLERQIGRYFNNDV